MSGLHVVFSNRTEELVGHLAAELARPGPRPLAPEWILIQGSGMERFLSLRLAGLLGVAANLRFPFPGRFIDDLLARAVGKEGAAGPDLRRLAFRLAAVIPAELNRPEFASVKQYVESGDDLRLFRFARQLADAFDQYWVHRPEMLTSWCAGDLGNIGEGDRWQAILWLQLAESGLVQDPLAAIERLRQRLSDAEFRLQALPERLFLFGVSTVRGMHRRVLQEIARASSVTVFCLSARVTEGSPAEASEFLARLDVTGAEFRGFLEGEVRATGGTLQTCFAEPDESHALGRLQRQMLHGRPATQTTMAAVSAAAPAAGTAASANGAIEGAGDPADRSIRFASCHTPYREVEVLRDHLLDRFSRRRDLNPSDVLVLTPDIGEYAPLVEAVFGNPESASTRIPFHVADSRPGEGAELISALSALFEVALGRMTARQVLQLLEEGPIARHFGLEEAELEWVRIWLRETGIRWGWDSEDRLAHGLPAFAEGSWQLGLDRLLLGLAFPPGHAEPFGGVSPFTDVEGEGVEILGRLADLVRSLHLLSTALAAKRTPKEWAAVTRNALVTFTGSDIEEAPALRELLLSWDEAPQELGLGASFGAEAFAAQIRDLPLEVSAGKGFASGGVLFAALLPMRAVPYRVVCLLGMNEDVFPGRDSVAEFHLLYRNADPALPQRRTDDRLLFLETVLSAREEIYISYIGQDMYTNRQRQPSVVVAELRDSVALAEGWGDDFPIVRHRLQGYAAEYFRPDGDGPLFSYSSRNRSASEASASERRLPPPFLAGPLPSTEGITPSLDDLLDFFRAPGKAFLQKRFAFRPRARAEPPADEEDLLPDGLGRWKILEFLLEQLLGGRPEEELERACRAEGLLSPGSVGQLTFERELGRARIFAAQLESALPEHRPSWVEANVTVGSEQLTGRLLVSRRGVVVQRGGNLRGVDFVGAWLRHLFLQLLPQARAADLETILVGRKKDTLQLDIVRFGGMEEAVAGALLGVLVDLYRRGLCAPLPFLPRSSFIFAETRRTKGEEAGLRAAQKAYYSEINGFAQAFAEQDEPWVALCFRGNDPLAGLADDFRSTASAVFEPLLRMCQEVPVDWEAGFVSPGR